MRIDSIIVDHEQTISSYLKTCILSKFPQISINGQASTYAEAKKLIKIVHPALIFLDVDTIRSTVIPILCGSDNDHFETIYISGRPEDAIHAIHQNACGFLLKPLNIADVVDSVGCALRRFAERASLRVISPADDSCLHPHKKLIGIPTMEGIEFLYSSEIIRCEGLQKCTRIVTIRKSNMVSSYCIGEFRKLLDAHGFFSCHKSHLINLMHVRKLTREGFIFLSDNIAVPLARRKKMEFLQNLSHL